LVPFLVKEQQSTPITELLDKDKEVVLWWATPVECVSALERRRREGHLSSRYYLEARRRLKEIVDQSHVVQAHSLLRERAERLLASHALRAADALQLAAALVANDERPGGENFVCLDADLRFAAAREGFSVLPQ